MGRKVTDRLRKRAYLVPKVSARGEDVKVDAKKFDDVLGKMLQREPETNVEIAASRRSRSPKRKD